MNGHRAKPSQSGGAPATKATEEPTSTIAASPDTPVNGTSALAEETTQAPLAHTNGIAEKAPETPATPQSAWGSSTPATWGGSNAPNGVASPAAPVQRVATPKVAKTPATSKMSWAQIARYVKILLLSSNCFAHAVMQSSGEANAPSSCPSPRRTSPACLCAYSACSPSAGTYSRAQSAA